MEAILGNVGSLMAFRLGVSDAPLFQRQFGSISTTDLINLPNYRAFTQLMKDGSRTPTFSAVTWPAES